MAKIIHRLLCAVAISTLPVAASAAGGDEYANIHTVAVVSAIGDTLEFIVAPRPLFQWSGPSHLNISDWGIDGSVEQQITQTIGTRFAVKTLTLDRRAVTACSGYVMCVDALPKTDTVDAYIVAYKTTAPDPISGNGDIGGLGMYHHQGLLGIADIYSVYAIYGVAIVDAKTGKVIDHGTARMPEEHFLGEHLSPIQRIAESVWPDSPPQLTAEQSAAVKEALRQLIAESLPHALQNANLYVAP